jgi:hypothetical protein
MLVTALGWCRVDGVGRCVLLVGVLEVLVGPLLCQYVKVNKGPTSRMLACMGHSRSLY